MKIAILGVRGIPVSYGGFEPLAERLALHLVERGHQVVVYGDKRYIDEDSPYHGVERINFQTLRSKALEKLSGAALQALHSSWRAVDVVLMLGLSPIAFALLPRLRGCRLVANVDGLEWKRGKWGLAGRTYLKASERAAVQLCHTLVADSIGMQQYYLDEYNAPTVFIPYGADLEEPQSADSRVLAELGLAPRNYVLQICRFEPENNALWSLEEYRSVKRDLPLVIVGDAPYADAYEAKLRAAADERTVFTGRLSGERLAALRRNAMIYIHGHEVGGTNPSLLEAMAAGNCVVANDVIFNREVLGDAGIAVDRAPGRLAETLTALLDSPELCRARGEQARARIESAYNWPAVLAQYERVLCDV
ncbi:MAG: DUF1972 domain-containing protein [Myxococcales bacterium]|nr:DUF1972 domain-containing protein [Myxococcales bacterium]